MRELLFFIREYLRGRSATGSLFPTSRAASEALVFPMRERVGPVRVLELGPGTGAVTASILSAMRDGDELDICEVNPRFMAALVDKLAGTAAFQAHAARVRFHACSAELLPVGRPYDVIVCSLPFMNFEMATVEAIFERLRRVSHAGTKMTTYSYEFLSDLGLLFCLAPKRRRLATVRAYLNSLGRTRVRRVLWNAPPLTVYALETRPLLTAGAPEVVSADYVAEQAVA